jgi:hypothetical protein
MSLEDPTDFVGTALQAEGKNRLAEIRRKQELDDIKWLMAHKQGRRFVHRLLSKAGIYRSSFTNSGQTNFLEGERNVGLFVINEVMEGSFDNYITMLQEHNA